MKRLITTIGIVTLCLVLAQVNLTLWESFANSHLTWKLDIYSITDPGATVAWLVHSVAIAGIVAIAYWLRRREGWWKQGLASSMSVFNATVIGAIAIVPGVNSACSAFLFPNVNDATFTSNWIVWMAPAGVTAHFVVAIIAAAIGMRLGRRSAKDASARQNPFALAAVRIRSLLRRLCR